MYTWFVYLANTGTKGFYIAQPSVQELPVEQQVNGLDATVRREAHTNR